MSKKILSDLHNFSGHIIFDHDGTLMNTEKSPFVLFSGMRELLEELKALHFEMYVWTARPRRSTLMSLKQAEVISYFKDFYCSDDGLCKPHVLGPTTLTEGINKEMILHIGDSITDIDGAHAFGIEVIAACWNNPDQVKKYAQLANYKALAPSECLSIIKRKFHV